MDVSKLMELIDTGEHLADIKLSISLVNDTSIIEERPEISSWNILHGQIHKLGVLKSVEQSNQPWCLGSRKNISLDQDVTNLWLMLIVCSM